VCVCVVCVCGVCVCVWCVCVWCVCGVVCVLSVKSLGHHKLFINNLTLLSRVLLCTHQTDCLYIANIGRKT